MNEICQKDVLDHGIRCNHHCPNEDYERKKWVPPMRILEEVPRQVWRRRTSFKVFAIVVYGMVIFPKVLNHIKDVVVDLVEQLDNQANSCSNYHCKNHPFIKFLSLVDSLLGMYSFCTYGLEAISGYVHETTKALHGLICTSKRIFKERLVNALRKKAMGSRIVESRLR